MLINKESEYNLIKEAIVMKCELTVSLCLNINIREISGNVT